MLRIERFSVKQTPVIVKVISDTLADFILTIFGELDNDGNFSDKKRVANFFLHNEFFGNIRNKKLAIDKDTILEETYDLFSVIAARYADIYYKLLDQEHLYTFDELGEGLLAILIECYGSITTMFCDYMFYEDEVGNYSYMYKYVTELRDSNKFTKTTSFIEHIEYIPYIFRNDNKNEYTKLCKEVADILEEYYDHSAEEGELYDIWKKFKEGEHLFDTDCISDFINFENSDFKRYIHDKYPTKNEFCRVLGEILTDTVIAHVGAYGFDWKKSYLFKLINKKIKYVTKNYSQFSVYDTLSAIIGESLIFWDSDYTFALKGLANGFNTGNLNLKKFAGIAVSNERDVLAFDDDSYSLDE